MSFGRHVLASLGLVLLAGCASLQKPQLVPSADQLSGRIAVRVEPVDPREPVRASSASFELHGNASAGELRLSSPLGMVLAVARWQGGRATLEARNEIRRFDTLQSLGREMLGEDVPVEALFDWLRGRPWTGAQASQWAEGRGFEQLGWRVSLAQLADGLVVATRAAAPVVTVRARLDR